MWTNSSSHISSSSTSRPGHHRCSPSNCRTSLLHFAFPLLAFLFAPQQAWAQVRIVAPEEAVNLFGDNGSGLIDGSTATFGAPYYGEKVIGKLLYRDPVFPDHPHCRKEGYQDYEKLEELFQTRLNITEQHESGRGHKSKRVMVVDRGGCTFVTKVRVAQDFGAGAVIVVDSPNSGTLKHQVHQVIMADDGYGELVKIPSVFISHEDGEMLKETIRVSRVKNEGVIAELDWNVPSNDVVIMDLWMSPSNKEAMEFLRGFRPIGEALINVLQFIPHYDVFDVEADYNQSCYKDNNMMCAEDPDGAGPITGKQIVTESLRQLCVWEINAKKMGDSKVSNLKSTNVFHSFEFWEYVSKFSEMCKLKAEKEEDRLGSQACSEKVMKAVGIDIAAVNECIKTDGSVLLTLQLANTAWSPFALRINGWRYSGPIEPTLVRKAICSGFIEVPQACIEMEAQQQPTGSHSYIPWTSILASFAIAIFVIVVLGYFCCRKIVQNYVRMSLQDEVSQQVSNQLAEYKALDEDNSAGPRQFGFGIPVAGKSKKKFSDIVLPPRNST